MSSAERIPGFAAVALLLAAGAPAQEAVSPPTSRTILERHGPAVITVALVIKSSYLSLGRIFGEGESRIEMAGTIISPDGLTVVSDFASNPSELFGRDGTGGKIETQTSDVRLLLRDGRELPGAVVLRDRDLDLAFIRPQQKGLSLPFISLSPPNDPKPLDEIAFLYPLGKALGREVAIATSRIRVVIKRPRTLLVAGMVEGLQALGGAAFDGSGRAIGLVALRRTSASPSRGASGFRELFEVFNPVIVPGNDVHELAAQTR